MKEYLHYYVGALTTVCLAAFGYVGSLGPRISKLETLQLSQKEKDADLKEYLKDLLDAKFEGLDSRLARIEANGNGHARS